MKKLLLLIVGVLIVLPTFAQDFEYTYEGQTLKYTILDEEAKTCRVSKNSYISGVLNIPSIAKDGEIEYTVTEIGESAFNGCNALTSVIIPESVAKIGKKAFWCDGLTEVFFNAENCIYGYSDTIMKSVFSGNIQRVIFGNSVKTIPSYAFYWSHDLESVTIGNSVTSIGNEAFQGCDKLTELVFNAENCSYCGGFWSSVQKLTIGDNVKIIPNDAFVGFDMTSVIIPNSVTTIGSHAFAYSALTSLTIPNSVTKIGEGAFSDCSSLTSVTIPNSVTEIGEGTFSDCSALTSVTIPNSVTEIGEGAFSDCSALTSVTIPESVTIIGKGAFNDCERLTELFFNAENCSYCGGYGWNNNAFPSSLLKVTFGDKVKNIPEYTFSGCSKLIEVNMGNSITEIGKSAFEGCSSLPSINIPFSVSIIGNDAFKDCKNLTELFFNAENCTSCPSFPSSLQKVFFGDNVINVRYGIFKGCTKLTEVNVSSIESWLNINFEERRANPTSIAKKLLVNGETIRRLTIPEGTKRINAYSFINCEPLVTVTFPTSLESIGNEAFSGCTGLQRDIFPDAETYLGINYDSVAAKLTYGNDSKIYIGSEEYIDPEEIDWPSTLTKIPDYAFYGNKTLKSIKIPETVTEIGIGAFVGCSGLASVTIPNSVTKIGERAFEGCSGLTSVTIPNSVTEIGGWAFRDCSGLTSVTIPNSVTEIGESAFYGCSGLTSMTIPNSVTEIGEGAFEECSGLTSVTIPNSVIEIGWRAFLNCNRLSNVNIQSVESWSQIKFGISSNSNPISVAKKFSINGSEVEHLDLDIDNSNVSDYAFYNAYNLKTIRIKDMGIGSYSFYSCRNTTDLCLDVDSIGNQSFANFDNLKAIYCMTPEPPVAPDDAFSKYEGVTLYVPVGSRSKYENAENCWWRFLDVIETDFDGIDAIFKADYGPDGVESVFDDNTNPDIDFSSPLEVYTLNGVRIADSIEGLNPGLYIVRQGNKSKKIAIK